MSKKFQLTGSGELEIDDGAYTRKFKSGDTFDLDDAELERIKRLGLSGQFAEATPTPNPTPSAPRKAAARVEKEGE